MRGSFLKFWIVAGAMWAAVASFGSRLHAMQAESKEIALFITNDEDDAAQQQEQTPAPKFWMGIALKPIEGDLATYVGSSDGVLVDSVYPDSPASKAGLEKGDIVVGIGDEKLTDPKSLLAQMLTLKADENGKAPTLKLKVLRKGETKSIDLTPAARPPEAKIAFKVEGANLLTDDVKDGKRLTFDLSNKSPEEIEKMIEQLHGVNSDVRVLRFGAPAKVAGDSKATARIELHKSIDGKNVEVNINREGDSPAQIVVIRDGDTKHYTSDKMDEMPDDIRKLVTDMLEKQGRVAIESRKARTDKDAKMNVDGKQAQDQIGELRKRITLISPNGNVDLSGVLDKEMAEKVSSMAKEIATRAEQSSKWAQAAAAMPDEVKELKSQVELLRAEIKELREQLRSTLKQPSEK